MGERRTTVRISTLFSAIFGLVVFVSLGTLLAVSTLGARHDLVTGLADEFDLSVRGIDARVREHLGVVDGQLAYLGGMIATDPGLADDNERLLFALRAALSGTPQVTAIAFMRPDLSSVRLERDDLATHIDDLAERAEISKVLDIAAKEGTAGPALGWSEPLYSASLDRSIVVARRAVWRGRRLEGVLFAALDLTTLSRFTAELSGSVGHTVFILYGQDHVLAHPNFLTRVPGIGPTNPLPRLADISDAALTQIWRSDRRPVISQDLMEASEGHYLFHEGGWHVYVYREIHPAGTTPWILGYHFDSRAASSEVHRFWRLFIIGIVLLVVFSVLGTLLGRRLSRPIKALTKRANAIQRLDLEDLPPMGRSRITEFDRTQRAFDAMGHALRAFARYAPRRMVETIVREGRTLEPEERTVTVMFVDLVGFAGISESLGAAATTHFLNDQFGRIGTAIDDTGGTIDKYVGDGVLAFWNAPDDQPDHADRACRAASLITADFVRENAALSRNGKPPVELRIGIHTGPVIVGDIGAGGRVDYTAIGDTVNIASRVEDAARHHGTDAVTTLLTGATVAALTRPFDCKPLGKQALRGMSAPVDLYRLRRERQSEPHLAATG